MVKIVKTTPTVESQTKSYISEGVANIPRKPVTLPPDMDAILRMRQVIMITGRSRASLYRDMAEGLFPQSVRIGKNSIGWMKSAVSTWLESRQGVTA